MISRWLSLLLLLLMLLGRGGLGSTSPCGGGDDVFAASSFRRRASAFRLVTCMSSRQFVTPIDCMHAMVTTPRQAVAGRQFVTPIDCMHAVVTTPHFPWAGRQGRLASKENAGRQALARRPAVPLAAHELEEGKRTHACNNHYAHTRTWHTYTSTHARTRACAHT